MKKLILFAAVLSAVSFASCKKDHTCTCTSTSSTTSTTVWGGGQTETDTDTDSDAYVYTINKAKKKDAKKACIDNTSKRTTVYGPYSGYNTVTSSMDTYTRTDVSEDKETCSVK